MRKVYGPYTRAADGRQHVILDEDGIRRTVSYPKFLMEEQLGRRLDPELETVDHRDRDFTNNALDNLRLVSRSAHSSEDHYRVAPVLVVCVQCGAAVERKARTVNSNAVKGRAGPFCSKRCVGLYGAAVQQGLPKLPPQARIDPDTVPRFFLPKR